MKNKANIGQIHIPQVQKVQSKRPQKMDALEKLSSADAREFDRHLHSFENSPQEAAPKGLTLSQHAIKRLQERELQMDSNEFLKLNGAIKKLKEKGAVDSLVLTDRAAYIVDVTQNKVVTAMEKGQMREKVFTKIDSTIMV